MAVIVWGVMAYLATMLPMFLALLAAIMIGALSFFIVAQAIRAFEISDVKAMLKRS